MPSCRRQAETPGDTEGDGFVGKVIGIVVVIGIGVFALWLLVDRALFPVRRKEGSLFAFLLICLLFYLADRRRSRNPRI